MPVLLLTSIRKCRFENELTDWSAIGRMHAVSVPTLIVNGRADKVSDYVIEPIFWETPKVKWVTMDGSSHMPFWEERERFHKLVDDWLRSSSD
jgi:pimeloyl-ACP methyl ester carboxylesterase